jgi:DNA-binding MarR family transcriptional regulator
MKPAATSYTASERLIAEALAGLAELAGPNRHWTPVSTIAREVRRSITATSKALEEAESRGLAETRVHENPRGRQREYRPRTASGRAVRPSTPPDRMRRR